MRSSLAAAAVLASAALFVAGAAKAEQFGYKRDVSMKVGQTVVLKGVRADCAAKAPLTWAKIRGNLPKSKLGTFSDGGVGTTRSNACKGVVPARGVRFTATTAGREAFNVYNDPIVLSVR